jgi:hypothetical protein
VVVTPESAVGATLAPDEEVTFRAELRDDTTPIDDVSFRWSVTAGTGNGSIESVSHDGRTAVFKNIYRPRSGLELHTGGNCKVTATAIYRRNEYRGSSAELGLGT